MIRTLYFLLEKEFRQIMRNKGIVRMLVIAPVIQLILLPLAADYSVKNISIAVVDNDHSTASQRLIGKITSSGYFKLTGYTGSYNAALSMVEQEKADLVLQIPAHFERDLVRENSQKLYIAIDAIEGTKANLGGAYLNSIITDFNEEIRVDWHTAGTATVSDAPQISVATSNWYNPFMNFHLYIVPAILVTLVTAMAAMQTAFNIVQEKENGTIEQINVTPIQKWQFILGKLIPFWVVGMIVFTLGLLVAWGVYGIWPVGSFGTLYLFAGIYLVALLGFGLLVSTYTNNQLQAMFVAFFFMMIFMLMSGLFTSVDSMPGWAKVIANLTPVTHFITVMRMIVLKGSGLADVQPELLYLVAFAVVLNGWAILNYRKTN